MNNNNIQWSIDAAKINSTAANVVAVNLHGMNDATLSHLLKTINAQKKGNRLRPVLKNLRGCVIAEMGRRCATELCEIMAGAH